MKTIKEINELAPYDPCEWQEGYGIWQNGFMEGQKSEAAEMEQNPSDALIMRILNCIGYEDEGWIDFVRKELEKRKEK